MSEIFNGLAPDFLEISYVPDRAIDALRAHITGLSRARRQHIAFPMISLSGNEGAEDIRFIFPREKDFFYREVKIAKTNNGDYGIYGVASYLRPSSGNGPLRRADEFGAITIATPSEELQQKLGNAYDIVARWTTKDLSSPNGDPY